jgi:hypothetical protein
LQLSKNLNLKVLRLVIVQTIIAILIFNHKNLYSLNLTEVDIADFFQVL